MFVPYDQESGLYINNLRWDRQRDREEQTPDFHQARQYKRRHAAVEFASLKNVNRNIPKGVPAPNKHYQNRAQVVVHEIDSQGQVIQVLAAPPRYIYL